MQYLSFEGRRAFSPGARQRIVKTDGYRERKPYPSPVRKPRMETHSYQEPERRPFVKPAHKIAPEPRVTNAAVIEKKPVLLNPTSVAAYPPLPQRTPVQRQPPKPVPQKPEPVKTVLQRPEPVKAVPQKPEPVKTVPQKVAPVKTVQQKVAPVKTVQQKVEQVKTVPQKVEQVKTVPQKVEQAKTVPQKVAPVKTVPQKVAPVKTVPQKVEQEKTVPQKVEPAKTTQKPAVVQKQEAKPGQKQQKAQNPELKSAVENKDVKPAENKAAEPEAPPPAEPSPDGSYQLDPLTSRALGEELHQIMAQVPQELPKEPPTDAERLVVAKFNSVAGDDLKNALGLNVTKRLLNQLNPLYVKLVFSRKPEAGCLQAFLAARRISAFKRIASPGDTFAARLDNVADFDSLCQAKEVTCGSAKVTVTPCYKFLACPSTLKTIYATTNEEDKDISDSNNSSPRKQNNVEKTNNSEAKTAELDNKVLPEDDNRKEVSKTEVSETKGVAQAEETKLETSVKNTKVASSPVTVNITIEAQSKTDGVKNTSKEIPKLEAKKETAKPVVNNKVTKQNDEVNKAKGVKDDSMEEMTVVDEHLDDDEEEMTDHDILALMSGGIVLDECSGSDDEK